MVTDIDAHTDPATLDAADPLRHYKQRFVPDADAVVYLDGNSLGRPPHSVREAVGRVLDDEWPHALVRGWDTWIDLPRTAGDRLAAGVVGARPGEVLVADSTSLNLYKLAGAALALDPNRTVLVTDDDNFPTDRYVLEGLAHHHGGTLRMIHTDIDGGVDPAAVAAAIGDDTAVVCLSQVAYRSGALADMAAITALVHDAGALMLWDLCHSAGVLPVDLAGTGADLAVGCTYKYLNAGPGAPAFLYVREDLQTRLHQPIWGWFSQSDQFEMGPSYRPVPDIGRFSVGTPHIMGVAAVDAAVTVTAEAGIEAIRTKSLLLGRYATALFDERLADAGFRFASPRDPEARGGHITLEHPDAWQIAQAMRAEGVIPDYRSPNRIRLGFAPLYNSFTDVDIAMDRIAGIVASGTHHRFPAEQGRVT